MHDAYPSATATDSASTKQSKYDLVAANAKAARQTSIFKALAHDTIGVVTVLAEEKRQVISFTSDESVLVHADSMLLQQAVLNLLDNAVKYSPSGGEIRVALNRALAGWVELRVEDQGPGIPEADRARIFDRFYRVGEARSREGGGIGLGLAIARWAVEANGGEIGVRPARAGGSEFYLSMPATG